MEVLDRLGQLTAGEIAVQTGITSGAVTAMLDRLEREDLVQRRPDTTDRRRVLVQLTDKAGSSQPRSTDRLWARWRGSRSTPTTSSG